VSLWNEMLRNSEKAEREFNTEKCLFYGARQVLETPWVHERRENFLIFVFTRKC
jgi:hypothetical protein